MRCLLLLTTLTALAAADLPLGVVESVGADGVLVKFDAGTALAPDDMLALYGPGKVEKHPLTKEVIREQRQLAAKAQIIAVRGDGKFLVRTTWTAEGATIVSGHDAVPMPGEASPDAPPVLAAAAMPTVSCTAQGSVRISLPVKDPEGGPLSCTWTLQGPVGSRGRLSALSTGLPTIDWYAPSAGSADLGLTVTVADAAGQKQSWSLPLLVTALPETWRNRQLDSVARMGTGADGAWNWLGRGPDGTWWVADERGVTRIESGWLRQTPFTPQKDVRLVPLALEQIGDELIVLDGSQRAVLALALDGVLRRRIGGIEFRRPTDLAVARDGAVLVADQDLGGVVVLEKNGSSRCRLGQADGGEDAFVDLQRIALGPDDTCYALDVRGLKVHVFDRNHRRLGLWPVQTTAEKLPVDLAVHPLGLLVLLADGSAQIFDRQGLAGRALPSLAEKAWLERLSPPTAIAVDGAGEAFITFPREGVIARYGRDGSFIAARGAALWATDQVAVDGDGTSYALSARDGMVRVLDSEGWLRDRIGGLARNSGPFETPGPMAVSPDGRWLCVLDLRKYCVHRFDLRRPGDRPLVFGQTGTNNGQFKAVTALACDEQGRVYVLDASLRRVSVFRMEDGVYQFSFGRYERGRAKDELVRSQFLTVTTDGSTCYIFDSSFYEIQKFTLDHTAGKAAHAGNGGGRGRDLGQFSTLAALACDRNGLLYALDTGNRRLSVIDFRASNAVAVHGSDLAKLGFRSAEGMALAPDGQAWVVDSDGSVRGLGWK